jgi:hypothetical protein
VDRPRVAVIAVHGVADQNPGETARAVADLLVSSAPEGTCYAATDTEELILRVAPLAPRAASGDADAGLAPTRPSPQQDKRTLLKALVQSARSDFQRTAWTAPETVAQARQAAPAAPPAAQDRGIAVTNYLLTKFKDNGARPETYATTRLGLRRHGPADSQTVVDVYEMYWADLSRLSGSMPRIVSEAFTMMFRLSKLGRETVDEMWGQLRRVRDPDRPAKDEHPLAWNVLGTLQIALDWLYVNGLALLFAQLGLLAIVLTCLGYLPGNEKSPLHDAVAVALGLLAVLRWVYRRGDGSWLQALAPVAVLAAAIAALAWRHALLQWLTAIALLGLVTAVNEVFLKIADERFPLVRFVGRAMWAACAALMLACAWQESLVAGAGAWRDTWVHATLFTTEVVLMAIKGWWILAGALLLAWCVAGLFAQREGGYAGRASVATGRLGVLVSMGLFLMITMTTWAAIEGVLKDSAKDVGYRPCLFALEAGAAASSPASAWAPTNVCPVSTPAAAAAPARPLATAATVLEDRYIHSTSSFATLATLLLGLLAYLLAMFTPPILAELKLIVERKARAQQEAVDRAWRRQMKAGAREADPAYDRQSRQSRASRRARTRGARELGRWLSGGYRALDGVVLGVTLLGVLLSLAIAALFCASFMDLGGWPKHWFDTIQRAASDKSEGVFDWLRHAVFGAAGVGITLSVLGGQLSRHIPSLRAPLDIAMDVDNHFREFPRTDIPRAHIFSRYAALLEHLQEQGYDRIVVVAHSQGTVISAELLRFLSSAGEGAPAPGDEPALAGKPLPPLSLLTMGSPLRQLYGARFPALYAWVLARNGDVFGPRAGDIGAQRWMNAFCSGDYVGRWLWSSAARGAPLTHPMANGISQGKAARDSLGRLDAYTGFFPDPPRNEALLAATREAEVCLGVGAHTHYFERDQTTVAWLIDWLVRAPAPPADAAGTVTVDATDPQAPTVVAAEAAAVTDGQARPASPQELADGSVAPP